MIIIIVLHGLNFLPGLLALIVIFPLPYFLILFYLNIRRAVYRYARSHGKVDNMPAGVELERERMLVKYSPLAGVLMASILCCCLYWYIDLDQLRYGSLSDILGIIVPITLLIVFCFYMTLLIDISYTAEYFSSGRVRVNYANLAIAFIISLAVGAFVFLFMRKQIVWYVIFVTMIFMLIAALTRTRKTVDFLKYADPRPENKAISSGLMAFNVIACFLGVVFMFISLSGLFTMIFQVFVVVNLTKTIFDVS